MRTLIRLVVVALCLSAAVSTASVASASQPRLADAAQAGGGIVGKCWKDGVLLYQENLGDSSDPYFPGRAQEFHDRCLRQGGASKLVEAEPTAPPVPPVPQQPPPPPPPPPPPAKAKCKCDKLDVKIKSVGYDSIERKHRVLFLLNDPTVGYSTADRLLTVGSGHGDSPSGLASTTRKPSGSRNQSSRCAGPPGPVGGCGAAGAPPRHEASRRVEPHRRSRRSRTRAPRRCCTAAMRAPRSCRGGANAELAHAG